MSHQLHVKLPTGHPMLAMIEACHSVSNTTELLAAHAVVSDDPVWLQAKRDHDPAALRILLDADDRLQARSDELGIAHQVLTQDAVAHDLCLVVSTRTDAGMESMHPISDKARLPALPRFTKLLMETLDDPDVDAMKVKRVLQKDPAMVAKMLKLANSPLFQRRRTISTLDRAIVLLGLANVRIAAMSAGFFGPVRGVHPKHLEASRDAGLLAVAAVRKLAGAHAEVAVTAALLLDIGKLVLLQHDREYPKLMTEAEQSGTPLAALERAKHGTTHAEQGARLLCSWGLPMEVCEAIALSHTPLPHPQQGQNTRSIVYVAGALVDAVLAGRQPPPRLSWLVDEAVLADCYEHLCDQLMMPAA